MWVAVLVGLVWRKLPQVPESLRRQLRDSAVWRTVARGWTAFRRLVSGPELGDVRGHLARGVLGVLEVARLAARNREETWKEWGRMLDSAKPAVEGWGGLQAPERVVEGDGQTPPPPAAEMVAPAVVEAPRAGGEAVGEEGPRPAGGGGRGEWPAAAAAREARWAAAAARE